MPPSAVSSLTASGQKSFYSRPATTSIHGSTFNDDRDNLHRVEFEAPLTADADAEQNRLQREQQARSSIDYSLELERQLAMESPPQTPAYDQTSHQTTTAPTGDSSSLRSDGRTNELAPDPDVLAHIITQLRHSLADMTKERDELVTMLETANKEQANRTDALQALTDKATAADEELTLLRRKSKEDEDQIVLLRAKVEESRRGLMRLQTENRRQSMAPIDVGRASSGTFASFTSPPSSKRASFVPLTGSMQGKASGHRRNGSVNDANLAAFPVTPDQTPSPNMRAFNIASAEASLSGAPSSSRRFSGLFGRQADNDAIDSSAIATENAASAFELETVRKELQVVKDELENVKHELGEMTEAKEASDTCVTALRDFIADNNVGVVDASTGLKLPPPPTMATGEDTSGEAKKSGSGWGFKLWGNGVSDTSAKSGSANVPHSASSVASSPIVPPPANPPNSAAPPLSRKIGGFFTSRSSTSSSASRDPSQPQALHLQTNAAATQLPSQRDSLYSHSDISSIAEPISPGSDINGLGNTAYTQFKPREILQEEAVVKDSTSIEASSAHVSMSGTDIEQLL